MLSVIKVINYASMASMAHNLVQNLPIPASTGDETCPAEFEALTTCFGDNYCDTACADVTINEDEDALEGNPSPLDGIFENSTTELIEEQWNTYADGLCDVVNKDLCEYKGCCSDCISQIDAYFNCVYSQTELNLDDIEATLAPVFEARNMTTPDLGATCNVSGHQCASGAMGNIIMTGGNGSWMMMMMIAVSVASVAILFDMM